MTSSPQPKTRRESKKDGRDKRTYNGNVTARHVRIALDNQQRRVERDDCERAGKQPPTPTTPHPR